MEIVYQAEGECVSIVYPLTEVDILEVGKASVPEGIEFWVVDTSEISADRTFREAWDLDKESLGAAHGIGNPSGYYAAATAAEHIDEEVV